MGKNNTTKISLGPNETTVVARLSYEKATVVTLEQLKALFGFDNTSMNRIVFRLKKKGILRPIKKGIYFYSPLESGPAGRNINEFLVPSLLYPKGNYYVGYGTMYNYYGFTDQIFQQMCILNTSKQYQKAIGGMMFKMIKIAPRRLYGLETIKIRGVEVIVSDKERTLVDLVNFSKPVGGLKQALNILKEQVLTKQVNTKKLIKYASQFPIASTRKRIGFILEEADLPDEVLKPLTKSVDKTSFSTLYDIRSRKGKINKRWRLIENAAAS